MSCRWVWNEEADRSVLELWERGFSATDVAYKLDPTGAKLTRNAVIGRLNRLRKGNRVRAPQTPRAGRAASVPKKRILEKPAKTVAPIAVAPPLVPTEPCELLALGDRSCRWPVGEGLFCNGDTGGRGSYCAKHSGAASRAADRAVAYR